MRGSQARAPQQGRREIAPKRRRRRGGGGCRGDGWSVETAQQEERVSHLRFPLRALARPPPLYPPRQSMPAPALGASEARKRRALLCFVAGGEETGVVEMGCLRRGWGDFGQWKEWFWGLTRWARAAVASTVCRRKWFFRWF